MTEFAGAPDPIAAAQRSIQRAGRWIATIHESSGIEDYVNNGVLASAADRALDRATARLRGVDGETLAAMSDEERARYAEVRNRLGETAVELQPQLRPRAVTIDGRAGVEIERQNDKTGGPYWMRGERKRNADAMLAAVPRRQGLSHAYRRYSKLHGRDPDLEELARDFRRHGQFRWQIVEGLAQTFDGSLLRLRSYAESATPQRKRAGECPVEAPVIQRYTGNKKLARQQRFSHRGILVREIEARLDSPEGQPATWADVSDWYRESYPLRERVYDAIDTDSRTAVSADTETIPDTGPLAFWGQYWAPDLAGPRGKELGQSLVRIRLPHVSPQRAAELEQEFRPDRPFLSIIADDFVRIGIPEADAVRLGGWDMRILNLMMIAELRGGRPVGREKLIIQTGLESARFDRFMEGLMQKLNRPKAVATIIRASRGENPHYRINPNALVLDARPPKSEKGPMPSQAAPPQ